MDGTTIDRTPLELSSPNPLFCSATEQLRLLHAGQISAVELAELHLEQIERLNPVLRAFVDVDPDRVRAEARRAQPGRLRGLPMSFKSSIATAGHRCEIGSRLHHGYVPEQDALAVAALRREGVVTLGTTNCPELLMAYETANVLHGATANPWDLSRSAGGSSGGEAAAIAAGMSAAGLGSDSGGSVRQPAHFTGICALKPTAGRISPEGHLPPCVGPFAKLGALGPMARTMEDVALLFQILTEASARDPLHAPVPLKQTSWEPARMPAIGYFEDDESIPVTPETRAALQAAARALREAGLRVEPFRPRLLGEAQRLWHTFFVQCGAMFYQELIAGREQELSPIFRNFLEIAEAQPPLSAATLLAAWAAWDPLCARLLEEMQPFPLLLLPVCSVPAFRHGERAWTIDGKRVDYLDAMCFMQWFNVLGAPAAVVPVGRSAEGLPIGVQIAGKPYSDELVLAVAQQLDRSFGYQRPPVS